MAKNLNSQDCHKYRKIDIQVGKKKTKIRNSQFAGKKKLQIRIKYDNMGK